MPKSEKARHRPQPVWAKAWYAPILIGVASLVWFLVRSGPKPSRAAYPCQKAALANASALLGTLALPALLKLGPRLRPGSGPGRARLRFLLLFLAAAAGAAGIAVATGAAGRAGGLLRAASGRATALPPAQEVDLSLAGRRLPAATASDIYAVQGTTGADAGFRLLLQAMEGRGRSFYSLFQANDVLLLKVNSQWDERGGTNTDLVKAIVQAVLAHPAGFAGEVVIVDNGQGQYGAAGRGGSLDWENNNAEDRSQSMRQVAESFATSHRVSTFSWDRITTTRVQEYSEGDLRDGYVLASAPSPETGIIVSYPKFATRHGTLLSFKHGVWDPASRSYDSGRLKVINVPVLKSHAIYGVTACVKHYMGVVSDKLTGHAAHYSVGAGGMGTQMAGTRPPVLNVLDAIWINAVPGGGPRTSYSQATRAGIVAASRDPAALDYWAAKSILLPAARELGHGRADSLDPDSTRRGSFGDWLRLSLRELQRAGQPFTLDLQRVNITVSDLRSLRLE